MINASAGACISLRHGADADADTLTAYRKNRLAAYGYPRSRAHGGR